MCAVHESDNSAV